MSANNYNRTFTSQTTTMLNDRASSLQSAGDKIAEFNKAESEIIQEVRDKKEDDSSSKAKSKDVLVEEEEKKKSKNPLFAFLDKLADANSKKSNSSSNTTKKAEEANQEKEQIPPERPLEIADTQNVSIPDLIAPIDMEIDFNHIQMGDYYFKTLFVDGYPRFVGPNWLSPIINFEHSLRISTFYYPVDSKTVLDKLKKKIGEMEATLYGQMEDRKVVDPSLKVALSDAQQLQDSIAEGTEKFFHFAMYITMYANSMEALEKISRNVTSTLAAMNVTAKPATLMQEQAFISSEPCGIDNLYITRNMDTTSLATTFPFVTSELTMDHGIMYGLNQHNKSLVIFDRFELENANTVVFAKSGSGKSYFVKLEAIRSLMLGTEVIIIDPEKEYDNLARAVNGAYISFSQDKGNKMNPFELSGATEEGDDELRTKLLSLQGFLRILFGGVSNIEGSILDKALILTYREKGITFDPRTQKGRPPMLEDLYKVLKGMAEPEARGLANRLERYIMGSSAGVFNEETNFEINNPLTVFSIRDLQDELKPMAMYLMLDFIWTKVRKDKKRRILIVDEAWYMMQSPESAEFMYSIAKRARKYYLGLSTISQDVTDFLNNDMGRAIITNSSLQMLMKQSPTSVDQLQTVFNLSDGEKQFLLNADVGQGLFFAGASHVGIQVLASVAEHEIITSNPKDLEKLNARRGQPDTRTIEELAQVYVPEVSQAKSGTNLGRQEQIIQGAIAKTESQEESLNKEREQYKRELEERLRQQDMQRNPERYKNQKDFLTDLDERSISAQVVKSRKETQKGVYHATGSAISDEDEEGNNGNSF